MADDPHVDFGPRSLITPGAAPFLLSDQLWLNLQVNMATIRRFTRSIANLSSEMRQVAQEAARTSRTWSSQAFPTMLTIAESIRSFADTVLVKYPEIEANLAQLAEGAEDVVRLRLQESIRELQTYAANLHRLTQELAQSLTQIGQQCDALNYMLDNLTAAYKQAIDQNSQEMQELSRRLAEARSSLERHNQLYNEYVVIAATSATYAWIPIAGWIAGGAVAGTYGKRAADERAAAEEQSRQIAYLVAQLDQTSLESYQLSNSHTTASALSQNFRDVTPIVGKLESVWRALDSDLASLVNEIQSRLQRTRVASLRIALKSAVDDWRVVVREATSYVSNAKVRFQELQHLGTYATKVGYGGQIYAEHHELMIAVGSAKVNGVEVENPVFGPDSLFFTNQSNATRHDKPFMANITFTEDGFTGICQFPGEGAIDWYGTLKSM